MDCANHSGVNATAYCQNCGKALCASCVRTTAGGQILCEPCSTAWQSAQTPFTGAFAPQGQPNPAAAAALGVIPGVGAMYNGQFVKGLIHIFIFAILVSSADHFPIFGLFIAGWIVYQVFEAYHVAKARRDGMPVPDPLGLNEIGNWLNIGQRGTHGPGPAGPGAVNPGGGFAAGQTANPTGANPAGTGAASGQAQRWQTPYQGSSQGPYTGPYGAAGTGAGYTGPGVPPIPPIPPVPPLCWRRKEPIGAVILIALGLLFLMGQFDLFSGRAFEFAWPLILIGLGVWMVVRRMQDAQGGPK
jgi:TM2 domain-containing membrane protein YozV